MKAFLLGAAFGSLGSMQSCGDAEASKLRRANVGFHKCSFAISRPQRDHIFRPCRRSGCGRYPPLFLSGLKAADERLILLVTVL
jgi:hypothetical protein